MERGGGEKRKDVKKEKVQGKGDNGGEIGGRKREGKKRGERRRGSVGGSETREEKQI